MWTFFGALTVSLHLFPFLHLMVPRTFQSSPHLWLTPPLLPRFDFYSDHFKNDHDNQEQGRRIHPGSENVSLKAG